MEAEERPFKIRKLDESSSSTARAASPIASRPDNALTHDALPGQSSSVGLGPTISDNHLDEAFHENMRDYERDTTNLKSAIDEAPLGPALSKNQQKKLKRQQDWEAGRAARKVKRKEKTQEKKQLRRIARKVDVSEPASPAKGHIPKEDMVDPTQKHSRRRFVQLPITFVLDCGFDSLMLEKERISLAAQLTRCYSDNYKAPFQAHLAISSFEGQLKERFDKVLLGHYQSWKGVKILNGDFVEAAEQAKEWMVGNRGGILAGAFASRTNVEATPEDQTVHAGEMVYLTSDSPNTLTELKPYSTYIIGGLVDKNRHKGICYKTAMDRGFKTAKLPIGEYMEMTSRFVLATSHVVEIMLRWLELGDWGEAFLRVMPKRKGGVLKGTKSTQGADVNEDQCAEDVLDALDTADDGGESTEV
ncbi:tRNA (guanine(9)-N(1))-methyltransferase [Lignoscripta atroalba]|nr:tRNA (guanine(9)-N(1))-methyltransferase [Lignoscripta atroalba]